MDFSPSLLRDRLYLPLRRQGFSNRSKEFRRQTVPSHLLPPKDTNPFYSSLRADPKSEIPFQEGRGSPRVQSQVDSGRRGGSWGLQYSHIEESIFLPI